VRKRVGVLALQGNFREHVDRLTALGVDAVPVRRLADLDALDGLILPGGESTAVAILEGAEAVWSSSDQSIFARIRTLGERGLPVWGTCMGSILLAKHIEGSSQGRLALMDITVRRNAFGPQRFSSELPIAIPALGDRLFPGVFIRAPLITSAGTGVDILARVDEGIVMAREKNLLATVFHPEVVSDDRVHGYFLSMIS
jgi:pyridoxal 5'-phosphate synthase pdxT subunit